MQEASAPKRAQENPQTYRVGAVAGQGVLSTCFSKPYRLIKVKVLS